MINISSFQPLSRKLGQDMVLWSKDKRRHTSYFRFFNKFGLILLSSLEKKNSLCSHLGVESPPRTPDTVYTIFISNCEKWRRGAREKKKIWVALALCNGADGGDDKGPLPPSTLLLSIPSPSSRFTAVPKCYCSLLSGKKGGFCDSPPSHPIRLSYFLREDVSEKGGGIFCMFSRLSAHRERGSGSTIITGDFPHTYKGR